MFSPIQKKTLSIVVILCFVTACGGRTANPVMAVQYGDYQKSCEVLGFEIQKTEEEMAKIVGKRNKTGKNVTLGVTGFFLIVPLFFMDFKNAPKEEYAAYRQRYNHLAIIAMDKNCNTEINKYPTLEELEQEQREADEKKKKGELQDDEVEVDQEEVNPELEANDVNAAVVEPTDSIADQPQDITDTKSDAELQKEFEEFRAWKKARQTTEEGPRDQKQSIDQAETLEDSDPSNEAETDAEELQPTENEAVEEFEE